MPFKSRPSEGSNGCPSSVVVIPLLRDSGLVDLAQPRFIAFRSGPAIGDVLWHDGSDGRKIPVAPHLL